MDDNVEQELLVDRHVLLETPTPTRCLVALTLERAVLQQDTERFEVVLSSFQADLVDVE